MSQRFYGSICMTDLLEHANKKHSAFYRGENGKIYADVNIWLNDDEDKYGNIMSAQLNPKKELKEQDGNPYIGNFKESQKKPVSNRDVNDMSIPNDFAVREKKVDGSATTVTSDPVDDLPF